MEGGGGTFPEPRTWGKTSPSSFSTHQEGLRPKHKPFSHGLKGVTPPSQTSAIAATVLSSSLLGRPRTRGLSMGARLRSVPQHHSVLSDGARTEPVCHQGPRCIAPPAGVPSACLVFKLFACLSPTQNCWPPPTQPCRCVRSRCSEASRGKGGMLGQRAHPLERSRSEGPLPPPRKSSRPGLET